MDLRTLIKVLFVASAALVMSTQGQAASPGESEVVAASVTGDDIAVWLSRLPNRPSSIGIFSVTTSAPLDPEYANLVESELLKQGKKRGLNALSVCLDCRSSRVQVDGDKVVVTQGAPTSESLKELGKKTGSESFLTINIFRTSLSVVTQAMLYNSSTGEILGGETFRVSALELSERAMQFLLVAGPGRTIGRTPTLDDSVPFAINVMALEELGFGKGGLTLGGVFAHKAGKMFYLNPTLAFRTRFGATPVTSLTSISAGFGLTSSKAGLSIRGAYDIFLGTFTILGIEAAYLLPVKGIKSGDTQTLNGYFGVHLGVSLGR